MFKHYILKEVIRVNENRTNINWYPGHMEKTRKQIIEDLNNEGYLVKVEELEH